VTHRYSFPSDYIPKLDVRRVESAIKDIKDFFERNLSRNLNLERVSAPLFVRSGTGFNDDLNGIEKPVSFRLKDAPQENIEIVQSLAKWKRFALQRYQFSVGEGLYTDMNAIRPDETLDSIHSIYVDQWDWEKIILPEDRNVETLIALVNGVYDAICKTEFHIASEHSHIRPILPEKITFITAEELYEKFPTLSPKERENKIVEKHKAVFVIGIGHDLPDGKPHDGRAPDYDDWSTKRKDGGYGLNGDILLWNPVLKQAFEISSMGIRVDPETLRRQLKIRAAEDRTKLSFHKMLLAGELPQTAGGGIGQSRLCMFFLRTAHIGEVAVSIWPDEMIKSCETAGITLL